LESSVDDLGSELLCVKRGTLLAGDLFLRKLANCL